MQHVAVMLTYLLLCIINSHQYWSKPPGVTDVLQCCLKDIPEWSRRGYITGGEFMSMNVSARPSMHALCCLQLLQLITKMLKSRGFNVKPEVIHTHRTFLVCPPCTCFCSGTQNIPTLTAAQCWGSNRGEPGEQEGVKNDQQATEAFGETENEQKGTES